MAARPAGIGAAPRLPLLESREWRRGAGRAALKRGAARLSRIQQIDLVDKFKSAFTVIGVDWATQPPAIGVRALGLKMRNTLGFAAGFCALFALAGGPAGADMITGATAAGSAGPGGYGSFDGTLDVTGATSSAATIVVTLNNTTAPVTPGGYLTGFLFNLPAGVTVSGVNFTPTNANFSLLGGPNFTDHAVNGAPFGQFDIGAALGGNFEGGGSPNGGIAAGGSATFTFQLTGSGLAGLTASAIESSLSTGPGQGMGPAFFEARFKGFTVDPDSNHVPGAVPEPGSLALLGLGAAAMALVGARRSRSRRVRASSAVA
jgi:hypothetical protein